MNQYSHRIEGLQSNLSPSDQAFAASKLGLDDVETTKESPLLNPKLPKLMITSSKVPDQDDSEIDSPCWRGIHSHKSLDSGVKSVNFNLRLNPLAPKFIPFNSKKNLDMDDKKREEKSLSLTLPTLSGEFGFTDCSEDGVSDAAIRTTILTKNADEHYGFVSPKSVSKTASLSDTRKLDPLAPVFVPSSVKLSPSVLEKQTNAHSTSADDKSVNMVKVVTCSGEEASHSLKTPYGVHELGSTSSYSPWIEPEVGITKNTSSSNKPHGQWRLNPLASKFSLPDTKPKAYPYTKNQAADDLSLMTNIASSSHPTWDRNVVDEGLAQPSVYVEPNLSRGNSLTTSPPQWLVVEPNTEGKKDFKHLLPFHVVETAASSSANDVKALSSPSPIMDVKKLLTTIHGLSELLTLAQGSESSNSLNAEEIDLINSTVQNLNLYMKNSIQEQAGNQSVAQHNSYDLAVLPNKSKLSIRDLQLRNHTSSYFDVKEMEKYSMLPTDSRLSKYDPANDNGFGQVVANGYEQNHLGVEQNNTNAALLYKSLWLKAEAERSLLVYESSPSNPGF